MRGYFVNSREDTFERLESRMTQISGVFQKMILLFKLFHIMPFAKMIGFVEENRTKREFS